MKVTSDEIREAIKKVWPDIEYIWLWDNTYWKPPLRQAEQLLQKSNVSTMKFISLFNDCDDFALQFLAETRRKRYMAFEQKILPQDQMYPVTIGFAFGDMFRGMDKVHCANVFLADDGKVYIIDTTPAENRIWEAKPKKDNILFVFM